MPPTPRPARTLTFDLKAFEIKTADKMLAVVRKSAEEVLEAASTPQPSSRDTGTFEIGKVPVRTGTLRNSLAVDLNNGAAAQGVDNGAYLLKIAEMELGDVLNATWTAEYAAAMEYGYTREYESGQDTTGGIGLGAKKKVTVPGRLFVTTAVERWQEFVRANALKVKALDQ